MLDLRSYSYTEDFTAAGVGAALPIRLRAAGHRVFTPTQTGLGERAHLLDESVGVETFVADIVGVIEAEELTDVVLVGHSLGACRCRTLLRRRWAL